MKHCKPGIRTALLLTGNEILAGDIVDTNSTFIAREFLPAGVKISRKVVIGDDMDTIVDALKTLAESYDVVIVNGGLGSTVDDLTAEAVSIVTGRPLEENPSAVENIKSRYGRSFSKENTIYFKHLKKQAMLPKGVDAIPNPVGLAVGFKVKINQAVFYFTPGVPREMKVMIRESILPDIVANFPVNPSLQTLKLKVIGTGESRIQQLINQQIPPETWNEIDLGFRASMAIVEVKLSIKDESSRDLLLETQDKIRSIFSDQIASLGESLQEVILQLFKLKGAVLGVIENCSAGQIVSMLNSVSEKSEYIRSGHFYQNIEEMEKWLDSQSQIEMISSKHLDVVVHENIATRFLEKSGTDFVLATSQAEDVLNEQTDFSGKKLIITCGSKDSLVSREYVIAREYEDFLVFVSIAALDLLRRYLLNYPIDNPYYFDELTRNQLK